MLAYTEEHVGPESSSMVLRGGGTPRLRLQGCPPSGALTVDAQRWEPHSPATRATCVIRMMVSRAGTICWCSARQNAVACQPDRIPKRKAILITVAFGQSGSGQCCVLTCSLGGATRMVPREPNKAQSLMKPCRKTPSLSFPLKEPYHSLEGTPMISYWAAWIATYSKALNALKTVIRSSGT